MCRLPLLAFLSALCLPLGAQPDWPAFRQAFNRVLHAPDAVRPERAQHFYDSLLVLQHIPYASSDSVMFLYLGNAAQVAWLGDFNQWGQKDAHRYQGKRIPGTNLWYMATRFDVDARLDYKIVLNGNTWILDPANPHQQWSGVGGGSPNSEVRMPGWKPKAFTRTTLTDKHANITEDQLFYSATMGYQISYSVYLPFGFNPQRQYPVLFVTDGYEYAHEKMGNLINTLDNLIAAAKIKPIIAVFIDHREPANRSNNRRMQELAMNEKYLTFLADEFVPFIQTKYPVVRNRSHRAILGTSMGGLAALYAAYARPDCFGLAGVQSPAFWVKPEIFAFCQQPHTLPVQIYLSCGTIFDGAEGARKMKALLENQGCSFLYQETHQGHSWGNWRDQLDDMLIYFFKPND